jgi:UPF0042 nucleotide-binding protein
MKITSFSYKTGPVPTDDCTTLRVFDCRGLDNPHHHPVLRTQTGLDKSVQDFVLLKSRSAQKMIDGALTEFATSGRDMAFGCAGGRHRSVAVVEIVAKLLRDAGVEVEIVHTALAVTA